jgi:predicted DNA-binding transcriptional regulator AlpA
MNVNKSAQVREWMEKNPKMTAKQIMKETGFSSTTVYNAMSKTRKKARKPKESAIKPFLVSIGGTRHKVTKEMLDRNATNVDLAEMARQISLGRNRLRMMSSVNDTINDTVNHPAHYKVGGIETIDFIEAKKLGYNLGNVVKYVTRAGHKGNIKEDLEKARWYLNRELENLSKK